MDEVLTVFEDVIYKKLPMGKELFFEPTQHWYALHVFPLEGDDFTVVIQNITEDKISEEQLKANEQFFRTTFNSIGDAIITTDLEGYIHKMNPVAEKLTGWNYEEARGMRLNSVLHLINTVTKLQLEEAFLGRYYKNGETISLDSNTSLISKTGKEYQIEDSAAPIIDQHNNVTDMVLVFRDATEKYENRKKLQERVKELNCLYDILHIKESPNITLHEILQYTAKSLPQSWLYPEFAEFSITYNDREYTSECFRETLWKQRCDLIVNDCKLGSLEICYTAELPTLDEGPFLREEIKLLSAVADLLAGIIASKQSKEELRISEKRFRLIAEHAPVGVVISDQH